MEKVVWSVNWMKDEIRGELLSDREMLMDAEAVEWRRE